MRSGRLRHWIGPRGRRILHTGGWSVIAKSCAALNLFGSVPFVLHDLGPVQFGAWATLTSLVAFSGFLDFGFGNGTMNLVAAAHGRGREEEIAGIVHAGYRALRPALAGLVLLVAALILLVPWQHLLGLPASLHVVSLQASAIVLFSITLAVPLNLANRVQLGRSCGHLAFRWQALGQLLSAVLTISLAMHKASLPVLTAASVTTPLLGSLGNTLGLRRFLGSTPHPADPVTTQALGRGIRREGLLFFILQLSAALAYSADLPLISALRGASEAGIYAIVERLFSVIPLGLSLVWISLWPIYRQSLAARDHAWVLRTLRNALVGAVGLALFLSSMLAFAFRPIIALWIHHPVAINASLVLGFAVLSVIHAAGTALATFLNAASIMRFQIMVASIFALTCFAAKYWVIAHLGIEAVPWATSICYALLNLIPTMLYGPRLVRHALTKDY